MVDEPPQGAARGLSTPSPTDPLRDGAAFILGRPLTDSETRSFDKYLKLLLKWQGSQRLVGSAEPAWIVEHIFLDSLLFSRLLPPAPLRILDVGSGAGVPGVPLKIVLAESAMTLLESRAKRASFLSTAVRELALRDCEVVHARLEALHAERRGRYDALVMRCAGDPAQLREAALPLLTPGGLMIASGPPQPRPTKVGAWREVRGPTGPRQFWVYQNQGLDRPRA